MVGPGIDFENTPHGLHIHCWRCGNRYTIPIPRNPAEDRGHTTVMVHDFEGVIPDWLYRRLDQAGIDKVRCTHCEAYAELEFTQPLIKPPFYNVRMMPLDDDGYPYEEMGG